FRATEDESSFVFRATEDESSFGFRATEDESSFGFRATEDESSFAFRATEDESSFALRATEDSLQNPDRLREIGAARLRGVPDRHVSAVGDHTVEFRFFRPRERHLAAGLVLDHEPVLGGGI